MITINNAISNAIVSAIAIAFVLNTRLGTLGQPAEPGVAVSIAVSGIIILLQRPF